MAEKDDIHPSGEEIYVLPTDSDEKSRLDGQHRGLTLARGSLCATPQLVEGALKPDAGRQRLILDMGTGSGVWAEDMARAYPHAKVIGIDIVPPPRKESTPSNCEFRYGDINAGFGHYDQIFDVVHFRSVNHGTPDFKKVMHDVAQILRPGGILLAATASAKLYGEDREIYPLRKEGEGGWSAAQTLAHAYLAASVPTVDMDRIFEWGDWLEGMPTYENVGTNKLFIPIGPWVQDQGEDIIQAGEYFKVAFGRVLPALGKQVVASGQHDQETVNRWLPEAEKEIRETKYKLYSIFSEAWAVRSNAEYKALE